MASGHIARFDGLPRESFGDGLTVVRATNRRAKRRGLARLDMLPPDHALHIPKCSAVHTFGMHFSLDLIWLDRDGSIVRVDEAIPPHKLRRCGDARSVVETVAGEADRFLAAGLGLDGRLT